MSGRLALFAPSLAGGGAERALVRLAGGLVSRGEQVDLVLARADGPYLPEVSSRVRIVNLGCSRVLSSVLPLSRYLRRERPAALLSTLDYANIVAIWARRLARSPVRLVVNEQNMITVTAAHSAQKRQQMVPLLIKWFYPWADHVVGNSEDVARTLRCLIGA